MNELLHRKKLSHSSYKFDFSTSLFFSSFQGLFYDCEVLCEVFECQALKCGKTGLYPIDSNRLLIF